MKFSQRLSGIALGVPTMFPGHLWLILVLYFYGNRKINMVFFTHGNVQSILRNL
jgi:hypothetical protein